MPKEIDLKTPATKIYFYVPTESYTSGIFFVSAKNRAEADNMAEKYLNGFFKLQYGGDLKALWEKVKADGVYDALGEG